MSFKVCSSLLVPFCLVVCGCSSKVGSTPASLSGTVSLNGTPLKGGTITFHPKEGGVYPTYIKEDGSYSIASLPVGEVAVAIETESLNPNKAKMVYGGGRGPVAGPQPDNAPEPPKGEYVKISPKYADPKTSQLSVNLNKGKNVQTFDLTDSGAP
jgi:hypothetical protein